VIAGEGDIMQAIRVHTFGGVDALVVEDVARPTPGDGEVLLRVGAAGVGPWDALIRSGRSVLPQPLPLTLGSDVAGVVECLGPGVRQFAPGDAVFGATNGQFTGGYAEYAVASATTLAKMPRHVGFTEAASVPVVACTAWQMVFEYGAVNATKRVVVHGAAGNVGAYAVQLAKRVAREVVATASSDDIEYVRSLGANRVVDAKQSRFEKILTDIDVVLDPIGGDTQERSFAVLKPGGVLVSAVRLRISRPQPAMAYGLCSFSSMSHRSASNTLRPSSKRASCIRGSATCCHWPTLESLTRCWQADHTREARSC
jgi:NADPH:quinone reductase-like Zn-dependent oxidoreductase